MLGLLAVLQGFVLSQEDNSESSSLQMILVCALSLCPGPPGRGVILSSGITMSDETLLHATLPQVLHPLSPRAKTPKHSASRLCSVWNRVSLSSFWPAAPWGMSFSLAPAILRHQQRYDLPSRQVDVVYRRLEPRPAVHFAFEFSRENTYVQVWTWTQ